MRCRLPRPPRPTGSGSFASALAFRSHLRLRLGLALPAPPTPSASAFHDRLRLGLGLALPSPPPPPAPSVSASAFRGCIRLRLSLSAPAVDGDRWRWCRGGGDPTGSEPSLDSRRTRIGLGPAPLSPALARPPLATIEGGVEGEGGGEAWAGGGGVVAGARPVRCRDVCAGDRANAFAGCLGAGGVGQPRRHLLTTGWSSFVNKKKLISGDAVLFLRGDDGELRLGVRRVIQLKNEALFKAFSSDSSRIHTLSAVANSLKHRSVFHICYNPRATASEFIVPHWKFLKGLNHPFCIGMRFKIRYESEDVNERRSGIIAGINDVDPMRWPGSKWRSLLVRWGDGTDCNSQNRVSPWEIEIVGGSVSITQSLSASSSKRTKLCPQGNLNVPTLYGNGHPDSMETEKFPRVLQGQELMGSITHRVTCSPQSADVTNFKSYDTMRFLTDARSCMLSGPRRRLPPWNSGFTNQSVGFGESVGFPEVLQGQETSQTVPLFQGMMSDACSLKGRYRSFNYMRTSAAMSGLSAATQGCSLSLSTLPPTQLPSASSDLPFNQTVVPQLELASKNDNKDANGSQPNPFGIGKASTPGDAAKLGPDGREVGRNSCRLFGFCLTEKILPTEEDGVEEGNYETDCQNPRMLELFGHSRSTPGALHALCAAPLGI